MSMVKIELPGSIYGRQFTLGELMSIDYKRQERAGGCDVQLMDVFHELKPETLLDRFRLMFAIGKNTVQTYYLIYKFKVISETGKQYIVVIRCNPDFDLDRWDSNRCQVYCECADFKYRSAYFLQRRKSLFVNDRTKTNLGSAMTNAPTKQSPTLLCKHAFAAVQHLINNYSSYMKTV